MMREIKFRAWIFGGLDDDAKPFMEPISQIGWDGFGMDWVKWTTHDECSIPSKECVLMQYTGLKDKNGTEIYEGDICKQIRKDRDETVTLIFEVIYSPPTFGAKKIKSDGFHWTDWSSEYFSPRDIKDREYTTEVIGNVYENPDLLE